MAKRVRAIVAARREADGSITYGMGFDEAHDGEHPALLSDGVHFTETGYARIGGLIADALRAAAPPS